MSLAPDRHHRQPDLKSRALPRGAAVGVVDGGDIEAARRILQDVGGIVLHAMLSVFDYRSAC